VEGTFSDDLKRIEFDCKYYYVLNTRRSSNARVETNFACPHQSTAKRPDS